MKISSFTKTIRFRLTLWYSIFLILILAILVIGIYTTYRASRPPVKEMFSLFPGDSQMWIIAIENDRNNNLQDLQNYSLIGVGAVLIFGLVGGYFLSGFMLKPVTRVSSLASRISHTNLKERIKHNGPEDEVKRLADTFDNMLERLEHAFESQKQFIQDASHELRTPIAIAQTNIEVLEMEGKATREDYKQLVDIIKLSLQRMNDVNNNLLLLSEGTPAQSRWARVDIVNLLNEVYEEANAEAKTSAVNLEWQPVDTMLFVRGDSMHLKQVMINLVDNAIKYNRPGGSVKLSVRVDANNIVIQVSDTGTGIPQEDLDHIFDRFFRVEKSRSRDRGGSGLGLAIVRKIVEDHGGAVSVESTMGEGSTFYVVLPKMIE
jgi:signal transduction histidine kinase